MLVNVVALQKKFLFLKLAIFLISWVIRCLLHHSPTEGNKIPLVCLARGIRRRELEFNRIKNHFLSPNLLGKWNLNKGLGSSGPNLRPHTLEFLFLPPPQSMESQGMKAIFPSRILFNLLHSLKKIWFQLSPDQTKNVSSKS